MVVTCGENAEVVARGDGGSVRWLRVSRGESVLGDCGFRDVVSTFSTDNEAFMSNSHVECCSGAFEEVGKQTGVDVGLLVVQVQLAAVVFGRGEVVGQDFGFETFGQVVFELEFGVEAVRGGPGLCQGQAWVVGLVAGRVRMDRWSTELGMRSVSDKHTGSFVDVFPFELQFPFRMPYPEVLPGYYGAHRARNISIMGGFSFDIECDAIGGFRLDLEVR